MKIHQLPDGARFEYQGEEYVKTGPLFATGKAGQRFIPKYAVLKPLGEVKGPATTPKQETLSRANVLGAFEAFYAECRRRVPADHQIALDAAREQFIRSLD